MIALPLSAEAISRLLPHRYPFLLVDRVIEAGEERCVALKNVTINEPFFVGHFPDHPIMPGVLILEALAQAAALHGMIRTGQTDGSLHVFLMAIERAKFRRPVVPGDQLRLHTQVVRAGDKIWKFRGEARVEDQVATEADFLATVQRRGAEAEPAQGQDAV
jgi:beta-hydroxyacyl-ACP dehydratase FabZ